ncbi:MAG: hypothetical protein WCI04_00030 [archaeon]
MADFVATKEFKTPYVISTGQPHRPTAIKTKQFQKGDIISGEMKTSKGKPAFVLYKGVMVIPLTCIRQVITKEINTNTTSGADGDTKTTTPPKEGSGSIKVVGKTVNTEEKKKRYLDGIIVGALAGFGATYYAEKKGWIPMPSQKNKIIGAVVGALAGFYAVYRFGLDKTTK